MKRQLLRLLAARFGSVPPLVEQGFLQVSARATEDSDENAEQFL